MTALEDERQNNAAKRGEKRPAQQQPKRTTNAAAWGSLKPHTTQKKNEQEKNKKKTKKTNRTERQATKQTIPTGEKEIATDTVRRGRLPKFKDSDGKETVESNSNPDEETTTHRSGSPNRHEM
jgi:hypothetical protein